MIQKTDLPITYDDVRAAWKHVGAHLEPTPLRRYPLLDELVGATVFVKHENLQPTHAFKARNAFSALGQLGPEARRRGVIADTRGNHGLGLCYAGQTLGIGVTICVPVGNNPEKNDAIRSFGATLVEEGQDYDETLEIAKQLAARDGLHTVHSTNDRTVIAGAATLTDEILAQLSCPGSDDEEIRKVRSGLAAPGPIGAVGGTSEALPWRIVSLSACGRRRATERCRRTRAQRGARRTRRSTNS